MKEIHVEAVTENLDTILEFMNGELEASGCPMKLQMQMNIAAEEIFVNIASYAYKPETGVAVVRVSARDMVVIEFEDSGKPYNPLENEDPDISLSADERQVGGLGVFMVKQFMDEVDYRYEGGKNILTLKKLIA